MAEPTRLPRAEEATIPTDKLVRYALDPNHPRGGHKARVYEVVVQVEGLNGATRTVITTWIVAGDAPPRLTTTRVQTR